MWAEPSVVVLSATLDPWLTNNAGTKISASTQYTHTTHIYSLKSFSKWFCDFSTVYNTSMDAKIFTFYLADNCGPGLAGKKGRLEK